MCAPLRENTNLISCSAHHSMTRRRAVRLLTSPLLRGLRGSEDLEVRKLATVSGFAKYHITCKNCKGSWVQGHCYDCSERETGRSERKLGKHPRNYYRVQPGSLWNVVCPGCGARL